MKNKYLLRYSSLILVIILLTTLFTGCGKPIENVGASDALPLVSTEVSGEAVEYFSPKLSAFNYKDSPYISVADEPMFLEEQKVFKGTFEHYSELDGLGRCGVAYACLGKETMPTEDRESLSSVTPSGWNNKSYDFVDGGWIYNRAHLIGFQLSAEQANKLNLITGTRYFNVEGMLPFENMVADYIHETENHVLYRVTPIYTGDNLVCDGVTIEAWSLEDNGESICFYVFCYNVQPDITIDYKTGNNWLTNAEQTTEVIITFILNTRSKKFHYDTCSSVSTISANNKSTHTGTRQELINMGYSACGICKP